MKNVYIKIIAFLLMAAGVAVAAEAQQLNDKLMNRPYADLRKWHLGFGVGLHVQDLQFTHNGFVTEDDRQWCATFP